MAVTSTLIARFWAAAILIIVAQEVQYVLMCIKRTTGRFDIERHAGDGGPHGKSNAPPEGRDVALVVSASPLVG
jgi:hypothetical protein